MTSPKKVAANRANGRKSRGPNTSDGKARASRNARRHGLAAVIRTDDPVMAKQVNEIVDAICEPDDDPLLREQAAMIAENQIWLSRVGAEKVAKFQSMDAEFAGLGDLEQLLRYEKRAWSRRKKAIRAFLAIKLTSP